MGYSRFNTTIEIRETEGEERWSAILYGRALPFAKNPAKFGVENKNEDTSYRGRSTKTTEPLGVEFPEIEWSGRWSGIHFATTDARIDFEPKEVKLTTPNDICRAFERFAIRNKVLAVVWSGGVSRIARWDSFTYEEIARMGTDRAWKMKFKVLGLRRGVPTVLPSYPDLKKTSKKLAASALDIDKTLFDVPPGMSGSFVSQVRTLFTPVQNGLGLVRSSIAGLGEIATAPFQILGSTFSLLESVRNTIVDASNTVDAVVMEFQTEYARAENILRAKAWSNTLRSSVGLSLDSILELMGFIQEKIRPTEPRYISVTPGESMFGVAKRAYGPSGASSWFVLAELNGFSSAIVPPGVSRIVVADL